MDATRSLVPSHGMFGWSHASHASLPPSGLSLGAAQKSEPEYRTCWGPSPLASTATMAFTGSPSPEWSSRTQIIRPRSPSNTPSAYRSGASGVMATGSPPRSWRYSRWSAKLEKYTTPSATRNAPPPYSWTLVRTLNGVGVNSVVLPSGPRRTITIRPPSEGRISTQYTSSPSRAICPRPTAPDTIREVVIGDFHEPYGAVTGMSKSPKGICEPVPAEILQACRVVFHTGWDNPASPVYFRPLDDCRVRRCKFCLNQDSGIFRMFPNPVYPLILI